MRRREFVVAAALLATGCAGPMGTAGRSFSSERISVTTQGSGPDVVLVHGLGSSRDVWREMVAAVPGYRYHLVQMNGFGGEPIGGNDLGPVGAPIAEEIARYIAETGLQQPAIIGHSMGGHIAMQLAARHPDAVSKVMVVDMLPFVGLLYGGPTATSDSVRPIAEQTRDRLAGLTGEARQKAIEATLATMIKTEGRRAEAVRHSLDSDAGMSARAMHELITSDLRPELATIKAPVTVLYVRSPALPITDEQMDAVYRSSFAALPGARLTRIPDSYHFIMWDAPERFAREVRDFLRG